MAGTDVFASLNKFLSKGLEEPFKYDAVDLDSSSENLGKRKLKDLDSEIVDLSNIPAPIVKKGEKGKRGAKTKIQVLPDLIVVTPPNNASGITEVVALPEELNASGRVTRLRRARGRPRKDERAKLVTEIQKPAEHKKLTEARKTLKSKRISYKQALAIVNAPIPEFRSQPRPIPRDIVKSKERLLPTTVSEPNVVDLTGDVFLIEGKHSNAPLFQNVTAVNNVDSSSDDEFDLDMDFDAITVKVKIHKHIQSYPYRQDRRYYDLYKIISEQENVPMANIFLFDGDHRLHPDDTPQSTNYRFSKIYHCRFMESTACAFKQLREENEIPIKFQSDKWKKPIILKISRVDTFKAVIKILCEQISFQPDQISLSFDGDIIEVNSTPMDLDFEGDEIVDCKIRS